MIQPLLISKEREKAVQAEQKCGKLRNFGIINQRLWKTLRRNCSVFF
jgi:hypothetical protein